MYMKPFDIYYKTDYFILNNTFSRKNKLIMSLIKLRPEISKSFSPGKLTVT